MKATIADFTVEIAPLTWPDQWKVTEHGYGYRHPVVSASLRIRDVPVARGVEASECIDRVLQLLSLANRGYVFAAARHTYAADGTFLHSELAEPYLTVLGWPRALVAGAHLEPFLVAAYPQIVAKYASLDLAYVIDHCLQALSLRSAWPASLGVLTAMESLKAASDRATPHEPPGPKVQPGNVRPGPSPSPYGPQLKAMLDRFGVQYATNEVESFIKIRNSLIHRGKPRDDQGWQQVEGAVRLLEKALLAVLGYDGPTELFGEAAWSSTQSP